MQQRSGGNREKVRLKGRELKRASLYGSHVQRQDGKISSTREMTHCTDAASWRVLIGRVGHLVHIAQVHARAIHIRHGYRVILTVATRQLHCHRSRHRTTAEQRKPDGEHDSEDFLS